ncbi:MAG TPA: YeeE/YedE family protein [Alphaproteobacteria bacterium]|nr:YeeE/YedE family protein [Alphaproteobacteria bacterium]
MTETTQDEGQREGASNTAGASQAPVTALFAALILAGAVLLGLADWRLGALLGIGAGLGIALYHGSFGFTSAYRRAMTARDMGPVRAQLVMLAVAVVLFAPVLAGGRGIGTGVVGAVAPVDSRVIAGAFLFGTGMQIAGGCASGTLFTLGGGSLRMALTLIAFCGGGFWATFHLPFWNGLPSAGTMALDGAFGWPGAVAVSLGVLGLAWVLLGRAARGEQTPLLARAKSGAAGMVRGPWALIWAAIALAVLNFATLLVAGHPWSVTWGLTLWAAKTAQALGWAPETSAFWADGFPARALAEPVWRDTTSVMNAAIVLGAGLAAAAAGRFRQAGELRLGALAASVIGRLMLGYGARLAYACNIGAFFSGVASQSLHGWAWIVAGLVGTWVGIRARPLFGFAKGP